MSTTATFTSSATTGSQLEIIKKDFLLPILLHKVKIMMLVFSPVPQFGPAVLA